MSASEIYRVYASDCVALAKTFHDGHARTTLLTMAQAWSNLADRAERRRAQSAKSPATPDREPLPGGIDLSTLVFPKGTPRQ
jgi:hypothetical protein